MKNEVVLILLLSILGIVGCSDVKKSADDVGQSVVIGSQNRANRLKLRKDLQTINRAIQVFSAANGRYPATLDELARKGILNKIPREPFGGEWNYDPGTGRVTSSSHPEFGISTTWD